MRLPRSLLTIHRVEEEEHQLTLDDERKSREEEMRERQVREQQAAIAIAELELEMLLTGGLV